jgi:hypothetical protein
MKKFKVKISYEEYIEAENIQEATEKFWESKSDINTNVDNFIDGITSVEEILSNEEDMEYEYDDETKEGTWTEEEHKEAIKQFQLEDFNVEG